MDASSSAAADQSGTDATSPHSEAPAQPAVSAGTAFLQYVLAHSYTTASFVTLTIMGIFAVAKHSSEWNEVYYGAAKSLLRGGDMYRDFVGYVYPPFSAWVMIPFTVFPAKLARAIWYLTCALFLVYVVKSSWRAAGGGPLEPAAGRPAASPREQVAFLIGQACVLQLALNAVTHLQPDLLIAALVMVGCVAIIRGRFWTAATWLGLAGAFKVTPLLFAPYLLWRGRWAAAGWLVLLAASVNFLPDTVHAPPDGGYWLTQWSRRILRPMTRADYVPGRWANKVNNNQSVGGAVNRWMATTWQRGRDEIMTVQRPDADSPGMMRGAFVLVSIAILFPVGLAMWRRRGERKAEVSDLRPTGREPADGGALSPPGAVAIECGIVLLLMLLFSPNSSRSHFCIMFLPAFCVARLAVRPGASVLLRTLLALAVISSTLSIHLRLPSSMLVEQVLLWIGVVMFAALFLLFASTGALISPKHEGAD